MKDPIEIMHSVHIGYESIQFDVPSKPYISVEVEIVINSPSNEPFDMMFAAGWLNYPQAVAKKVFQPIDDLMDKYGQDVIKNIPKATLEAGRFNDKLYAVATYKEFASAGCIAIQKDLVDKYKLDLSKIKTIYDLDLVFELIKKNEPNVVPLYEAGGSLFG